jgi:hypothetical protein
MRKGSDSKGAGILGMSAAKIVVLGVGMRPAARSASGSSIHSPKLLKTVRHGGAPPSILFFGDGRI